MDPERLSMPLEAVAVAVPVFFYTVICLACGILLVSSLVINKERFTYVLLLALSTTLSAVVSIMQQCNNIANWHSLRISQYHEAVIAHESPSRALGALSTGLPAGLYWTQCYLYAVQGLLLLFWSIALVAHVWNWHSGSVQPHLTWIGNASKCIAIVLPAIASIIRQFIQVETGFAATLVIYNLMLLISLPTSTVCIILILVKYLRSRFGISTSPLGSEMTGVTSTERESAWARLKARVDPWLIIRFSIAWILVSGFEIALVFFCISRYDSVANSNIAAAPNFSAHDSILELITYVPAPTSTLLAFFIFGTTAPLRAQYVQIFNKLACWSRKHPTSPHIDRSSAGQWSRMNSQELSEARRYRIRDGQLERIELEDKHDPKSNAMEEVFSQDLESSPAREEKEGYQSRRRSTFGVPN